MFVSEDFEQLGFRPHENNEVTSSSDGGINEVFHIDVFVEAIYCDYYGGSFQTLEPTDGAVEDVIS